MKKAICSHCGSDIHLTPEDVKAIFGSDPADLYRAARLAIPWLGKMIADGGHLSAVAPSNAVKALRALEAAVLAAEGRE